MAHISDVALAARARAALDVLLASCSPTESCDGTLWGAPVLVRPAVGGGLTVYASDVAAGSADAATGCTRRYKGVCALPHAPAAVVAALDDTRARLTWDSNVAALDVVPLASGAPQQQQQQQRSEGAAAVGEALPTPFRATLLRSATKAVGPISAREFLDVCAAMDVGAAAAAGAAAGAGAPPRWTPPPGTLASGGVGIVADARFPANAHFVRGINGVCGWVFEPTHGGTACIVHYVIVTNLRGWLPALVVNASLAGAYVTFFTDLAGELLRRRGLSAT